MIDSLLAKPWTGVAITVVLALIGFVLLDPVPVAGTSLLALAVLLAVRVVWSRITAFRLPPPPGQVLTVEGARLHILAEGEAGTSLPVIWVAGGHGEGLLMHNLHQQIKSETRSILFDRPGSGWSALGSMPLTISGEVAQLEKLLEAGGESGPFVLAGHSFGGLFSVNFAHHYPGLVAGLVLMDPTPPWNVAFAGKLSFAATLRKARWWALAAQLGFGFLVEPEIDEPDSDYYRALADQASVINAHSVEPKSLLAEASVFRSVIANPFDLVIGSGALGDVPLALLLANPNEETQAKERQGIKDQLGLTDLQVANLFDGLGDSNEQQARLSTRGVRLMAPEGASHMFPYEHPEFVLAEVRKMIRHAD